MSSSSSRPNLAETPDFDLGPLRVRPSLSRVACGAEEARVAALTMSLLVIFARADGGTVSRTHLIDACWDGRIVTDDAIARAITKVRALARLSSPPAFELVTLPKVGYRLAAGASGATPRRTPTPLWLTSPLTGALACIALIAILAGGANTFFPAPPSRHTLWTDTFAPTVRSADVVDALLTLNDDRLRGYLRRGWDPNWMVDSESSASLHALMLACERNPQHDRAAVLRLARTLVEAGADPTAEDKWGDTPLEIAMSPRYCGPDHPVVAYLREQTERRPGAKQ